MYAEKGKGAFFNGNKVHVSETKKLEDAYIAISNMTTMMKSRHASQAVELSKNVKVCRGFIGLQAFIALANGSIDVYIEAKNHPWDIAASKIIIEEAGGRLTDFDGNDTIYVETALPVTNFFMKK